MKKIILLMSVSILSAAFVNAQAPVFRFESWAATPPPSSSEDPIGWASFNALTFAGMLQTVFKETIAPFEGTISAKIVTEVIPASVMIPNPFNTAENLDTVGFLSVGSIAFGFPPTVSYGDTYAWRPMTMSFASKYTPVGGDTAFVVALLTKWNGTSRDTVAAGWYSTGATTTSYSINNITMMYDPAFSSVMPDTQHVFVSSSVFLHDGAKKGSTFYIDDLAWSGYVSNDDINDGGNKVTVFPNPAIHSINLECSAEAVMIEVMDITGRSTGRFNMNDNKVTLQTHSYAPGIYMYNMFNKNNELVHRGKFEVTK